jgi:hypothetical protein
VLLRPVRASLACVNRAAGMGYPPHCKLHVLLFLSRLTDFPLICLLVYQRHDVLMLEAGSLLSELLEGLYPWRRVALNIFAP